MRGYVPDVQSAYNPPVGRTRRQVCWNSRCTHATPQIFTSSLISSLATRNSWDACRFHVWPELYAGAHAKPSD